MFQLNTARLQLRELRGDDAPFILALFNDQAFIRFIGDRGIRTLDEGRRYIEERMAPSYRDHGFGLWAVEVRRDATPTVPTNPNEPIGLCGLVQRDYLPDADLGFAYLPSFRSQGFAQEAARAVLEYGTNTLRMRRIAAIVQPDNAASVRLLVKLGFEFDRACKRSAVDQELLVYAYRVRNAE